MKNLKTLPLLILAVSLFSTPGRAEISFTAEGWHTWQVPAINNTPNWCCYDWHGSHPKRKACKLDSKHFGFSSTNHDANRSGRMQIYAEVKGGKLVAVRALSPSCPVTGADPIIDLGDIDADDSVATLKAAIGNLQRGDDGVVATVAVHDGKTAEQFIESVAKSGDDHDHRRAAIFWIGQLRTAQSGDVLRDIMRTEKNTELRHHAVFSYAQSSADDREAALIDIIENQSLSREDRKHAMFWLVQTESLAGIDYLQALLLD
ncbi:MAG: hypothetical protein AB8F65_15130 [Woeseiaceae bacterium]